VHADTARIGFVQGYSSPSMRAPFITTALENGAKLEDVQRTVGRADPGMTQLYDRGRFRPQKSAASLVPYETTPAPPVRGGEPDEVGEGDWATFLGEPLR
jgi:hypothetical protein